MNMKRSKLGLGALGLTLALGLNAAERRSEGEVPLSPPPPTFEVHIDPYEPDRPQPPTPPGEASRPDRIAEEIAGRVQEQVQRAAREAERMLAETRRRIPEMRRNLSEMSVRAGGPASYRTLILPSGEGRVETGQVREDLRIMGRVLEKALHPEVERRSNPFRLEWGSMRMGGKNELDALYLEGFGAIFLLEVEYPLAPSPVEGKEKGRKMQPVDEVWEEARREVQGRRDPRGPGVGERVLEEKGRVVYEADRVEGLRERLLQALRQARHLKGVQEKETVTVVVRAGGPLETGTVMTLRVGKADLDALGMERMTWEQFVDRVKVRTWMEGGDSGMLEGSGQRLPLSPPPR